MRYKWLIKEQNNISREFLNIAYGSEIIAKLLLNRGISTPEKAKAYLDPKSYVETSSEEIPDLIIAVDRIIEAINSNEKITIFGDYDVDGVTSTSLLLIVLRQFTSNVDFYIPSRLTEGYGLNNEAVKTIAKKNKEMHHGAKETYRGTSLLITCDCGITNYKETELANELGMDVIITDHHSLPDELPPAVAVLNPKLLPPGHKLHFLPGVGVAYKLAEAILEEMSANKTIIKKEDLLDLVTLGMIADLAPLVDENRYLVQIGLEKLANTEKAGLKELLKVCGCGGRTDETARRRNGELVKPNVDHIGFGIAPRINAVGRLTDAKLAVKLLTTDNLLEAIHITCELEEQNRQRQVLCEETLNEAIILVSEQVDLNSDKCIVLAKEGWHHGVVGIVASRIVEKFHLPTILIAVDKEQNIARGSGRSIGQLNIVEALVANSTYLEKYGGHKAACGLSVKPENINDFINAFKSHVNDLLSNSDIGPVLKVDSELFLSDLNLDLMSKIYKLSPFGLENPMPLFVSDEVEIVSVRAIGKNRQHLKLLLETMEDKKPFEALIWNHDVNAQFNLKDKIKIVYTPKLNSYNGETFIQLEVKDFEQISEPVIEQTGGGVKGRDGEIELFDFRGKTQECLNLFSKSQDQTIFFAETEQKNHLPLKTCSRNKILQAENLIFLEIPPDENVFVDIIKKSKASKIYLSFTQNSSLDKSRDYMPQQCLKRLIGMLKYVQSNKNSMVNEIDLQSALGLNKTALAFALETLKNIGLLIFEKREEELNINIFPPTRQNFTELIEYNLFVSELRQIQKFREFLIKEDTLILQEILKKNEIFVSTGNIKLLAY